MKVNFKTPQVQKEFEEATLILQLLAEDFVKLSNHFGIIPVMTRVLEDIPGATSVHPAGRALDFREEYQGSFLYTPEQRVHIVEFINKKWMRNDGKPTIIWHSFNGGPHHFHLQLASDVMVYKKK